QRLAALRQNVTRPISASRALPLARRWDTLSESSCRPDAEGHLPPPSTLGGVGGACDVEAASSDVAGHGMVLLAPHSQYSRYGSSTGEAEPWGQVRWGLSPDAAEQPSHACSRLDSGGCLCPLCYDPALRWLSAIRCLPESHSRHCGVLGSVSRWTHLDLLPAPWH